MRKGIREVRFPRLYELSDLTFDYKVNFLRHCPSMACFSSLIE